MERATIRVERIKSKFSGAAWRFILVYPSGEQIATTEEFTSGDKAPTKDPVVTAVLDHFLVMLKADGWVMVSAPLSPAEWWAVFLARGTNEEIEQEIWRHRMMPATPLQTANPVNTAPGCALWSMWGITLLVIVGLFAICVLLVLTSEIRLSPTT